MAAQRRSLVIITVSLAALALLAAAALSCGTGANNTAVTVSGYSADVQMKNTAFDPADLTIDLGTKVVWTNNDSTTHTVTADDGTFSSGRVDPGRNFSYTFNVAGTYTYRCTIHNGMTGKVTVR